MRQQSHCGRQLALTEGTVLGLTHPACGERLLGAGPAGVRAVA